MEGSLKVRNIKGNNVTTLIKTWFSVSDPSDSLVLRVNHKRISSRSGDHNSVLDGKIIGREFLQVPFTNSSVINEEFSQLKISVNWDTTIEEIFVKDFVDKFITVVRVEGTTVRDESASFCNITDKFLFLGGELVVVLNPTDLVILERVNKSVSLVHLLSGLLGSFEQCLLLLHLDVELLTKSLLKGLDFT